jgi:hypothetical protein
MLLILILPFIIGLFAVVYRCILAHEDITNWWFRFGLRYERRFFYKPIWGCELCIAGQMALWLFIFNVVGGASPQLSGIIGGVVPRLGVNTLNIFGALWLITGSIGWAFTLAKGYNYLHNKI